MPEVQQNPDNNGTKPPQIEKCLKNLRSRVERLLTYAISDANKDLAKEKPGFIEKISPILHKDPGQLSDADIAALLVAYNDLSQIVYPATNESLWLKEKAVKDHQLNILGEKSQTSVNKSIMWIYWGFIGVLLFVGIVTFCVQGHTSSISDTLQTVTELESSLKSIEDQINAVKAAPREEKVDLESISPVKELLPQRQAIWLELNNHYCMLKEGNFFSKLSNYVLKKIYFFWGLSISQGCIQCDLSPSNTPSPIAEITLKLQACQDKFDTDVKKCGIGTTPVTQDLAALLGKCEKKPVRQRPKCKSDTKAKNDKEIKNNENWNLERQICEKTASTSKAQCEDSSKQQQLQQLRDDQVKQETKEKADRNSYFAGAKATLRNLNYLLLPTLLGALGALAYVIRNILDSFRLSSFTLTSKRKWTMRVALGSALGLISGIVISPDIKNFQAATFTPLVWGFLMGYSVEFAFALFDSLIEKGRKVINPSTVNVPATGGNTALSPTTSPQVKALNPKEGPVSGGTNVIITGTGFTSDGKVYFGTTPAQAATFISETVITAISPAGEGTVNVIVVTDKGKSPEDTASQFTFLMDEESHTDGCDFEISDEDVTFDHQLPTAEGGVN